MEAAVSVLRIDSCYIPEFRTVNINISLRFTIMITHYVT
jgi:hypothetical protein